ncbi:MAG: CPBP family intramembrane metalloprotease [Ruminococcus sp.]|nr:CPBP family intramembrane metalloprotease [Ruminococcus sp.]
MKNKKALDILRIVIFTFSAYFLSCLFLKINPEAVFRNTLFVMFTPTMAHIITRLVTREKTTVKELLLPANLRGNIKYYVTAVVIPYIMFITSVIVMIIFWIDDYNIKECPISTDTGEFIISNLITIGSSFIVFYVCFGEEFGWRAYLTPKLESLMPEPLALIVSGIIWAMWHGVLIKNYGFNFGTGYKFFPYVGYIAMCIMCIFTGSFLTWITKKTDSIYPASIAHTVIDIISIHTYLIPEKEWLRIDGTGQENFNVSCMLLSGMAIIGVVFFVLLCIEYKKKKSLHSDE